MRTHCPACGEPLPDDGDRRYVDWCDQCGWRTLERKAADQLNAATFDYMLSCDILARTIRDLQSTYDRACGYDEEANEVQWEELDLGVRLMYVIEAERVLKSRVPEMRKRLVELRQQRAGRGER